MGGLPRCKNPALNPQPSRHQPRVFLAIHLLLGVPGKGVGVELGLHLWCQWLLLHSQP